MRISVNELEALKSGSNICVNQKLSIRDYTLICGKEKVKVVCTQWWSTFSGFKSSLILKAN
jgi:hypothetical protein